MYRFFNVLSARNVRQQLPFFLLYSRRLVNLTILLVSLQRQRFLLSYNVFSDPAKCLLPEFKSAATHLTDLDVVYCMILHVL